MTPTNVQAARRLERLQRVLAARKDRLARKIGMPRRQPRSPFRPLRQGPIDDLRRLGYPVALLLAATAVLPALVGFAWRRKGLLFGAAVNGATLLRLQSKLAGRGVGGRR